VSIIEFHCIPSVTYFSEKFSGCIDSQPQKSWKVLLASNSHSWLPCSNHFIFYYIDR
jgi:hypothetical protein